MLYIGACSEFGIEVYEDPMKKALTLLTLLLALSGAWPSFAKEKPYTIIAGDVLQVTVWKEDGLDREVLVLPNGEITFPLVGTIMVQGMTPSELQDVIKEKLSALIPDASVTVSVKAALGHTVSVVGQVQKPGEFMINRRLTVLQALSLAGGLTPYASESSIIVVRNRNGKEKSIPIPYDDIIEGENLDQDIPLEPGDVVVVPTAGLF